ncbi:MAG: NifU family protein [Bdellovibrionales bacterium]|nr:NifU family protein [Bdellovibrionales bacterium]
MSEIQVYYEATPNPESMKFVITEHITDNSIQFSSASETQNSPLASKLFGFPWTAGVFIGPNFVTVTKQDWVDWETLAAPLSDLIKEHVESGLPVLVNTEQAEENSNDSEIVKQIKQILNREIRPAVAMDGGDIVFNKYENGILYLYMQGACSGCPSSMITLKQGIEVRLQELFPEIQEVVAL